MSTKLSIYFGAMFTIPLALLCVSIKSQKLDNNLCIPNTKLFTERPDDHNNEFNYKIFRHWSRKIF